MPKNYFRKDGGGWFFVTKYFRKAEGFGKKLYDGYSRMPIEPTAAIVKESVRVADDPYNEHDESVLCLCASVTMTSAFSLLIAGAIEFREYRNQRSIPVALHALGRNGSGFRRISSRHRCRP